MAINFAALSEAGCLSLIRCLRLFLKDSIKLIRDNTSRDSSSVHDLGHGLVKDVNISENGDSDAMVAYITEEFVKFAGIESDLCDEKVCPHLPPF